MGTGTVLANRSVPARLAAAFLAIALSGAARVVPATGRPHRCACATHGADHECACLVCAAAARRARAGKLDELPPCHRGAARKALADEEEARTRRRALPGVLPACGVPEGGLASPRSAEPFAFPVRPPLALAEWSVRLDPLERALPSVTRRPAVPPPRSASLALA